MFAREVPSWGAGDAAAQQLEVEKVIDAFVHENGVSWGVWHLHLLATVSAAGTDTCVSVDSLFPSRPLAFCLSLSKS